MKNVLLGLGGVVGVLVLGFVVTVAMQPETTHVERSIAVAATPADVFPFANNFDNWLKWSPWQDIDPAQKVTFSESHEGQGAWYEWQGNDDVGHGRMTIRESVAPTKIVEDLHFIAPFEATAVVTLSFAAEGDGTKVTWAYDGQNDFMGKAAGLFMDMDAMLGADFEKGLGKLKPLAESAATTRVAAEQAAAAAAIAVVDPAAPVDAAAGAAAPAPANIPGMAPLAPAHP